jgi:Ion channel
MLIKLLMAAFPVVATVGIHTLGFAALLRAIMWSHALTKTGFWLVARLVSSLTCWLILIHLAEISCWGLFYFWQGYLPDIESALYFSAGAYTTVGSDIMLPKPWRILAPLEALTGALMFGLSTGLFFAVVSRWIRNWMERQNGLEPSTMSKNKQTSR